MAKDKTIQQLLSENEELKIRLQEAEDTLIAIREGAVDAIVVSKPGGEQVYTLSGEDQIYRILVETMSEGGLTTSLDGRILFCNERFSKLMGRPMEEITGRNIENFVQQSYIESMKELISDAQVKLSRKRIVFQAANGTGVPAQVSGNLIQGADSASICIVVTDLTELEATKETASVLSDSRRAALNLMEDAVIAREEAEKISAELEEANIHLQKEIAERKQAEQSLLESNEDLSRFNKFAVGRELRMIELKQEINAVCAELGQPARYPLDNEEVQP